MTGRPKARFGRLLSHRAWLHQRLRDPAEALAFLQVHLHDDGEGDHDLLLARALATVAHAQGVTAQLGDVLAADYPVDSGDGALLDDL